MTKAEQIRKRLGEIAAENGPQNSVLGIVQSVDTNANTCVLLNDDVELYDVQLRPVLTGKESITIYPKQNTWALAIRIESDDEWMVITTEEAETIRLKTDNSVFEIDGGFLMQRGNDTLKQVLVNIIEACMQIVVLQGNNPDYTKLSSALTKANNLLK